MNHKEAALQLLHIAESVDWRRDERLAHMEAVVACVALEAVAAHREDQRRTKALKESRKKKEGGAV